MNQLEIVSPSGASTTTKNDPFADAKEESKAYTNKENTEPNIVITVDNSRSESPNFLQKVSSTISDLFSFAFSPATEETTVEVPTNFQIQIKLQKAP